MSNQYFLARITGRDPQLRASDADRERVADRLRTSHAEGRLDTNELQERLEHCYEAKTFGQLDELVRDLPRQVDERGRSAGWAPRWRLAPLVAILLILAMASAASGHHHFFWLWIPIVFLAWRMSWWRRRQRWAGARRGPHGWI